MRSSPIAILILAGLFIFAPLGCGSLGPLGPGAKQKVAQVKDQTAIRHAQAVGNPVRHPLSRASFTVEEFHAPLMLICFVAFLLCAVSFGLQFTSFSRLARWGVPVGGAVMVGSFALLVLLPFLLWIIYACGAAIGALIIYELVRYEGNVGEALKAIETDVGIAAAAVEPTKAPATSPTADSAISAGPVPPAAG